MGGQDIDPDPCFRDLYLLHSLALLHSCVSLVFKQDKLLDQLSCRKGKSLVLLVGFSGLYCITRDELTMQSPAQLGSSAPRTVTWKGRARPGKWGARYAPDKGASYDP